MEKQKKLKIGKFFLLVVSFVLTIALTFSITLAWFYDSDHANDHVTMGGAVHLVLQDETGALTSGTDALDMTIADEAHGAFPGQNILVSVQSKNTGASECFVRAMFYCYSDTEVGFSTAVLTNSVQGLVFNKDPNYCWVRYAYPGSAPAPATVAYYLCKKESGTNTKKMYPLTMNATATYFFNSCFMIPETLTNLSSGKIIKVEVVMQAIQIFIPDTTKGPGKPGETLDNRLVNPEYDHADSQRVWSGSFATGIALTPGFIPGT